MTKESRPANSSHAQKTRAPKSPPWDAPPEPKRSGSQMPMTDETSSTRSVPPHVEPAGRDGDLSTLRKELIEARNLVIKTDNLLKNLHAELKQMGRKHEEQEKRHWMTSVTAYIAFAVIAGAGAIAYANAEVRTARSDAQANEARAAALQKDAEKIKAAEQTRRDSSEKALRVYELLGSEKEGPALNQAMTQAMHLDRGQLSALEGKAIDDRAAGMKRQLAEAARSAGESAYRRQRSEERRVGKEGGSRLGPEPCKIT